MFDVASGECELVDFLLTRFNPLDLKTKITVDPRCRVDEQIAPKPVDPDFPEPPAEPETAPTPEPLMVPPISAVEPPALPVQEAEAEAVATPSMAAGETPEAPSPAPPSAAPVSEKPLPVVPKIEIKLSLPNPPAAIPIAPEPTDAQPTPESPPPGPPATHTKAPDPKPGEVPAPNPEPEDLPSVALDQPSAPRPVEVKSAAPPSAADLLALIQGFHAAAQRYNSETAWEPPPIAPEEGGENE